MGRKRVVELDVLRVLACVMVIFMHTPKDNAYAIRFLTNSVCYMTSPCIGLFFMVSGAVLLSSKLSWNEFLERRLVKVLFPTLFWSLFYIFLPFFVSGVSGPYLKSLCSLPFSAQGAGHLWFMYTLVGLYLLTPILVQWISRAEKKELKFYLLLWIITLCYPILKVFIYITEGSTDILYYFSGYVGYYVLGYYLFREHRDIKWKYILPLLIVSLVAPVICRLEQIELNWMSMFWYLSIFVVVMCINWFKLVMEYGHKLLRFGCLRNFIISFSNLSFGIYFVHYFILRTVLWKVDFIDQIPSAPVQIFLWSFLTIFISYCICYIISRLPYAEYLIGYRKKREC